MRPTSLNTSFSFWQELPEPLDLLGISVTQFHICVAVMLGQCVCHCQRTSEVSSSCLCAFRLVLISSKILTQLLV